MKLIREDRWSMIAGVLAAVAAILMVMWVSSGPEQAEAVLGGFGNVTASDNPHNFSYGSSGARASSSSETRVCVFCHTPHSAETDSSLLNAPLWNHTLSTFSSYNIKSPATGLSNSASVPFSITTQLVATPLSVPDGASRLCMSCHDGTVSVGKLRYEEIIMATITSGITAEGYIDPDNPAYIGDALDQKHVVSVPMNDSVINDHNAGCNSFGQTMQLQYPWESSITNAETVFLRPTSATYGGPGIDGSSVQGSSYCSGDSQCTKNYKAEYNYGVQCSTCHDPHYWTTSDSAYNDQPGYKMLVTGVNELCGSCHYPC